MTADIFAEVKNASPICEKDRKSRKWIATYTARRGRTPHRLQPVFDREEREKFGKRHGQAVMNDYDVNGPHFWDGRNERW